MPEFFADGCPKLAAAIAYYALFSLFPLAIVAVAVFGMVVGDAQARDDVIRVILDSVPLREERGREELADLLGQVTEGAGASGALGLAALVLSASGVMGAVRFSLNTVWDLRDQRPPLRGKALDVLLVLGAGLAILASLAITIALQLASPLGSGVVTWLGHAGAAAVAFGVFLGLLRVVPATQVALRDLWPGAAVAALGWTAVKLLFGLYLSEVADVSAVYASLATVIAFLLFTWISANVFLLGAELAAELPRARAEDCEGSGPDVPLGRRVRGFLRGLVVRPPQRSDTERDRGPRPDRPGTM